MTTSNIPGPRRRCSDHDEAVTCERCEAFRPGLINHDRAFAGMIQVAPMPQVELNDQGRRVQIHVTFLNESQRWYPVGTGGWKVDAGTRCLIIGKGFGRVYVPLDTVADFSPEEY